MPKTIVADPLTFNVALNVQPTGDRNRQVAAGLVGDDPDAGKASGVGHPYAASESPRPSWATKVGTQLP